ncbi:hypothetical protein SD074_15010 [Prolixibacter sp. SD074]|nr:hypothetical protein SD074_15010 [Prolixibacter sp. SD074]
MELFIIPAIMLPRTVVELKAIPALIIIARKLNICPFSALSIGKTKINANTPIRTIKNEIAPLVIFPFDVVDLIFLKIHEFKISRIIKKNNTTAGSINVSNILYTLSIVYNALVE